MDQSTVKDLANRWISLLASAVAEQDASSFGELLNDPCYWRDLVALTWDTQQRYGYDAIAPEFLAQAKEREVRDLALDPTRPAPKVLDNGTNVELFIAFETKFGKCRAFVAGSLDDASVSGIRATLISTDMVEMFFDKPTQSQKMERYGYDPAHPGETWAQARARLSAAVEDPEVLVVGCGEWGASIAAELDRMGVTNLVVDASKEGGASWRTRYDSLALHTPLVRNNLPLLHFPETFPQYLSKDQWANWIEMYIKAMNINVLFETRLTNAVYDEQAQVWEAVLEMADGSERILRPRHVILAVGIGGAARIPDLPGLKDFSGRIVHSSEFRSGSEYKGKKVLVVGVSTSGHDIALDLYNHGAEVTMGQRSPATVCDIGTAQVAFMATSTVPLDEADQRSLANLTRPVIEAFLKDYTKKTDALDHDLHEGLRKAGMQVDAGTNEYGWLYKTYTQLAGYYLNVGCSEVIVEGGIAVAQMADFDHFVENGVVRNDGEVLEFDAIVMATGFESHSTVIESLMNAEIAEKVGVVGGFGPDGETRNLCRPTAQEHLWIGFGGIIDARKYAKLLAFQIKAEVAGIVPTLVRLPDGTVGTARETAHDLIRA